jgi:hypothetical protein
VAELRKVGAAVCWGGGPERCCSWLTMQGVTEQRKIGAVALRFINFEDFLHCVVGDEVALDVGRRRVGQHFRGMVLWMQASPLWEHPGPVPPIARVTSSLRQWWEIN